VELLCRRFAAITPPITAEGRAVIHDQSGNYRVCMKPGLRRPSLAAETPRRPLSDHSGGGKSSRLIRNLFTKSRLRWTSRPSQNSLILGSVFEIAVTARRGTRRRKSRRPSTQELAAFARTAPLPPNFGARAKVAWKPAPFKVFSGSADLAARRPLERI